VNPATTWPVSPVVLVAAFFGLGLAPALAQDKPKTGKQSAPTHADVRYGPQPRNVLDLYLPPSDRPTPLILYIHGGGFQGGDKRSLSPAESNAYLDAGCAVAALNYRLTDTAPMPAAYRDCGRALQFLRHNAKTWNLDPARVASTGGSAGAGTSLWLAFHDDLADPSSNDPVARESTRLRCVAVQNAQSSYDPRFAEAAGLPRPNFERHSFFLPFYGIKKDEIDTPKAYELYEEAAPITYLTRDDPPVLLTYSFADEAVTNQSDLGLVVHHPRLGIALKERMDKLGIECEVVYRDRATGRPVRHGGGAPIRAVDFVVRKLGATAKPAGLGGPDGNSPSVRTPGNLP
jgi:acetyl esterase/lipase